LNGNNVVDRNLVCYIIELGVVNGFLNKYDDAMQSFKEGEKLVKKITNPEDDPKGMEDQIKKLME
jgi:hypothetical protein